MPRRLLVQCVLTVAVSAMVASSSRASFVVPGTANIFGAGHSGGAATPFPSGTANSGQTVLTGGGTVAPHIDVAGGNVLTFSVTGTVALGNAGQLYYGPDGNGPGGAFSFGSYNGLSGYTISYSQTLMGVFVGAAEPSDPPPSSLDFTTGAGTSFTSLSPLLNQIFFIGDGLTGNGSGLTQTFIAPTGATRLFFGLGDSRFPLSPVFLPGFYDDNRGSFTVNAFGANPNPTPPDPPPVTAAPAPAGWLALAGGLSLGLGVRRRFRG